MFVPSFAYRLMALVGVMAIVAFVDWRRHPQNPTKAREYGFLLAVSLLGGVYGVLVDLVTSAIAPEYFWLKGIQPDETFRRNVLQYGFQAGLVAGALGGGCYLIANNPSSKWPQIAYRKLWLFVPLPIVCSLLLAPVGSALFWAWDPFHFEAQLLDVIASDRLKPTLAIWGAHVGLYAGGIAGIAAAIRLIRRERSRLQRESSNTSIETY